MRRTFRQHCKHYAFCNRTCCSFVFVVYRKITEFVTNGVKNIFSHPKKHRFLFFSAGSLIRFLLLVALVSNIAFVSTGSASSVETATNKNVTQASGNFFSALFDRVPFLGRLFNSSSKVTQSNKPINGQAIREKNNLGAVAVATENSSTITINGTGLFQEGVIVRGLLRGTDIDLGSGTIIASNVLYGLTAGDGIQITGDKQRPTVSQSFWARSGNNIVTKDPSLGLEVRGPLLVGTKTASQLTFSGPATAILSDNSIDALVLRATSTGEVLHVSTDNGGSVGVGGNNPDARFFIQNNLPAKVGFQLLADPLQSANLFEIVNPAKNPLFVVDGSGRVGIGTTSTSAFAVAGTSTLSGGVALATVNGKVGVGTTNPNELLSVKGTFGVSGDAFFTTSPTLSSVAGCSAALETDSAGRIVCGTDAVGEGGTTIINNGGGGSGKVNSGQATQVTFYASGGTTVSGSSGLFWDDSLQFLGVGTSSPGARLSVANGNILLQNSNVVYASSSTSTIATALNAFSFATSTAATPLLSFDTTNTRIGLGTTAPAQFFSIASTTYIAGGLGVGIATTSPGNIQTSGIINVQGTGSSTFANGINLSSGCFSVSNACVGGSGFTGSGASGQVTFFTGSSALSSDSSFVWDNTNKLLGLGTSSPAQRLGVAGNLYLDSNLITIGSTTAITGSTTIRHVSLATTTIPTSFVNAFSIGTSTNETPLLSFDTSNTRVGIGTLAPTQFLSIASTTYIAGGLGVGTSATTSPGVIQTSGIINVQGTATSSFANGINLAAGCFAMSGTCLQNPATTVNTGTANRLAFYSGTNAIDSANFLTVDNTNSFLGLSSSTPSQKLSVGGNAYLDSNLITIGSTTATTGSTTVRYLSVSTTTIPNSLVNAFSIGTSTKETPLLSFDTSNTRIGIGLSNPTQFLHIASTTYIAGGLGVGTSATTTPGVIQTSGIINVQGTGTSTFANGVNVSSGCFAIASSCLVTGVSSVANSDGTLTISPTTGNVIASLNLANPNTWTALQTFTGSTAGGILVNNASSTITNLTSVYSTSTSATTTWLAVTTHASTSQLTVSTGLGVGRSTSTTGNFEITGSALFGDSSSDIVNFNAGILSFANSATSVIPSAVNAFGFGTSTSAIPLLSFDTSNTRVGIGTAAPTQFLHIASTTYIAGGLGVGTTATTSPGTIQLSGIINAQSTTASSTFGNGINLSNGCFSISGTCLSSGGSGTISSGSTNRLAYYTGATTVGSANFLTVDATNNLLGLSSSTPSSRLSLNGDAYLDSNLITIGSTTAITGSTTIRYLSLSTTTIPVSQVNAFAFATSSGSTSAPLLSFDTTNTRIGFGLSNPTQFLSIASTTYIAGGLGVGTSATTSPGTIQLSGIINAQGTGTSTFANGIQLSGGCFRLSSGTCANDFGTGATGQVTFWSGATSLSGDNTFFWDNTNKLLGLSSSTPSQKLSVGGNAYLDSNLITIGSTTAITGSTTIRYLSFATTTIPVSQVNAFAFATSSGSTSAPLLSFDTTNTRIGIGLSNPSQFLSIASTTYIAGGLGVGTSATTSPGVIQTSGIINVQGTGTSTFANGIQLSGGCFRLSSGTCANDFGTGATGQVTFWSGATSLSGDNGLFWDNTNKFLGLGSTTPAQRLSVAGNSWLDSNYIYIGSTTAASTTIVFQKAATTTIVNSTQYAWSIATTTNIFTGTASGSPIFSINTDGGLASTTIVGGFVVKNVSGGTDALTYDFTSGVTTLDNSEIGPPIFDTDAGQVTWIDMPVASTTQATGTVMSYTAQIDGEQIFTVFGSTNGYLGGMTTTTVGIGTTTPAWKLSVSSATTTIRATLALTDQLAATTSRNWIISNQGGNLYFATSSSVNYASSTNTFLTASSSGAAGFSTTSPFAWLSINSLPGTPYLAIGSSTETSILFDAAGNIEVGTSSANGGIAYQRDLKVYNGAICADNNGTAKCQTPLTAGVVYGDSSSFAASDVAENYPVTDPAVEAGDIIMVASNISGEEKTKRNADVKDIKEKYKDESASLVDSLKGSVTKAEKGQEQKIIGAISTEPGVLLGDATGLSLGSSFKPVALSGRVPVKVSLEGGEIKAGDHITISSSPGIGMRLNFSGTAVGTALEDFNGQDATTTVPGGTYKTGKILVFINLGYAKLDSAMSQLASADPANPSNAWSVDQRSGKVNVNFFGNVDLTGNAIINVSKILSANGKWKIDEDGTFIATKIITDELATQKLKVGSSQKPAGITIFDETTGDPFCLKVKNGTMVSDPGECKEGTSVPENPTTQTSHPEPIIQQSSGSASTTPPETTPPSPASQEPLSPPPPPPVIGTEPQSPETSPPAGGSPPATTSAQPPTSPPTSSTETVQPTS